MVSSLAAVTAAHTVPLLDMRTDRDVTSIDMDMTCVCEMYKISTSTVCRKAQWPHLSLVIGTEKNPNICCTTRDAAHLCLSNY